MIFHLKCRLMLVSRDSCMRRKVWWYMWLRASVLNTVWNLWFWQILELLRKFISAYSQWTIWNNIHSYYTKPGNSSDHRIIHVKVANDWWQCCCEWHVSVWLPLDNKIVVLMHGKHFMIKIGFISDWSWAKSEVIYIFLTSHGVRWDMSHEIYRNWWSEHLLDDVLFVIYFWESLHEHRSVSSNLW